MKTLFSDLQKLVPGLPRDPKAVGQALTLTGFMLDGLEPVKYQNKSDWLLGFEVRQNRPDCLGVWGLAREAAAYYGLEAKVGKDATRNTQHVTKGKVNIKVEAGKEVKRIMAVKLEVKNSASPAWLKDWLGFYGMKSINLLVDLSNYVMLTTGYPSHLLDAAKVDGGLVWSLNKKAVKFTTLGQEELSLTQGELVIRDEKKILALAGLVGGQTAAVEIGTREIIAEMALYDPALIMKNGRALSVMTEAGNRLAKPLSVDGLAAAFALLINLLQQEAGAKNISAVFNHYPQPPKPQTIKLDLAKPGRYAGIDIKPALAVKLLKQLRCGVKVKKDQALVSVPSDRTDLELEEDLIEEVIRLYGYDKIPVNQLPAFAPTPDLTTPLYRLKDDIRDRLSHQGLDEILSQPLVSAVSNREFNYLSWQPAITQNSVNEDFPELRQSLASGLVEQARTYLKNNLAQIKIFEIGRVFGQAGNDYREHDCLAMAAQAPSLGNFQTLVEGLVRGLGGGELVYETASLPPAANPHAAFTIKLEHEAVGSLYKLKDASLDRFYVAEIELEQLVKAISQTKHQPIVELKQKLVCLDANVEVARAQELSTILAKAKQHISAKHLWSLEVVDQYKLPQQLRFTLRLTYCGLTDQEAKRLHQEIFK